MHQPQGALDDRVALVAPPVGAARILAGKPGAQHGGEQQVEQAIKYGGLTGLVADDFVGKHGNQRRLPVFVLQQQDRGQGAQQTIADVAEMLIGANQKFGSAGRVVPPGTYPMHHCVGHRNAIQVNALLTGANDDLRFGICIAGNGVVRRGARDSDIARSQSDGIAVVGHDPDFAGNPGNQRQRRLGGDAQGPGGAHDRAQRKGAACAGCIE